jgi:RND family efflux transporter MFP subunit
LWGITPTGSWEEPAMHRWKAYGRILFLRVAPLLAGLAVLIVVMLILAGTFHAKISPHERTVPVRKLEGRPTDTVHRVPKSYATEAVGKLAAADRTIISSRILATIQQITVNEGDEVETGQLLVQLTDDEYQSRLQQADEGLRGRQANLVEAESALSRAEQLRRSSPGTITRGEYDQIVARHDMAQSEVRRYRQAVEEAKVLLSYTKILAPKAGRIVNKYAESGDNATPGKPLLEIYDARSLRLEAPVPETLAVKLKPGTPLTVRLDALNREVEGVVDEIVPQADVASRSLLVKVALPEVDDLVEGLSARLLIPTEKRFHLCLASAAIREIGQLQFVDVVRDDDTLERRLIKTGRVGFPGRVEVLSGLSSGDDVVLYDADDPQPAQPGAVRGSPTPYTARPQVSSNGQTFGPISRRGQETLAERTHADDRQPAQPGEGRP